MKETEVNPFDVLHVTAKAINSTLRTEEVLPLIARIVTVKTGLKGCSMMLIDEEKKHLIHTVTYGMSDEFLNKGVIMTDGILADVMQGKPVIITDVSNDPRIQYPTETLKEGIASELNVPLNLKDEFLGVMRLYTAKKQEFSENMIKLLMAIAELSAIAIDNAKTHDSLKKAHAVCVNELGYWQP